MAWYTCDHIKSHEGTSLAINYSRIPEAWKFGAKIFQASLAVEEGFVNGSFPPKPMSVWQGPTCNQTPCVWYVLRSLQPFTQTHTSSLKPFEAV